MKVDHFDPPGNNEDFGGDANLRHEWTKWMSHEFDVGAASVQAYLNQHAGGICQFYNPLTHPLDAPDLPLATGDIPWNGFPKRHSSPGPGQPTRYADAEAPIQPGENRDQDEYLEWFVNKQASKIVS